MRRIPDAGIRPRSLENTFLRGEELGELRDYYGNLLYTSIATENGVVLYQTASLNIIEDGPMIAYAAITETLT